MNPPHIEKHHIPPDIPGRCSAPNKTMKLGECKGRHYLLKKLAAVLCVVGCIDRKG